MSKVSGFIIAFVLSMSFASTAQARGCEVDNAFFYRSSTTCPEDVRSYLLLVGDCKALERNIEIKRGNEADLGNMIDTKLRCANLRKESSKIYKKYIDNREITALMHDYEEKFEFRQQMQKNLKER